MLNHLLNSVVPAPAHVLRYLLVEPLHKSVRHPYGKQGVRLMVCQLLRHVAAASMRSARSASACFCFSFSLSISP